MLRFQAYSLSPFSEWRLVATFPLLHLGPVRVEITAAYGVVAPLSHDVLLNPVLYGVLGIMERRVIQTLGLKVVRETIWYRPCRS